MNIYLVSQTENCDYDTFDSFVVIAESEDEAKHTHPEELWSSQWDIDHKNGVGKWSGVAKSYDGWAAIHYVQVTLIGTALPTEKKRVVCASFNAG